MDRHFSLLLIFSCIAVHTAHSILLEKLGKNICEVQEAVHNVSNNLVPHERRPGILCSRFTSKYIFI